MNILIVEDNPLKLEWIKRGLEHISRAAVVEDAGSYQSGLRRLSESSYDFVILDMTLNVYDSDQGIVGNDSLVFGGDLILRECVRKRWNRKFIVITQYTTFVREEQEITFSQLKAELVEKYGGLVAGVIRLDKASDLWLEELKEILL